MSREAHVRFCEGVEVKFLCATRPVLMRIDLGFQVWKEQRIRFAALDTPAMDEEGGQEAYRYVLDQLSKAQTVVVKTRKIDVYGRYIGHIFYSMQAQNIDTIFTKGRYLNQELISQGLARKY